MVVIKDEVKANDRIIGITVALFLTVAVAGHGEDVPAQHLLVLEGR
jgi:hypothetical protein